MAVCKFCGKAAGLLRREHAECRQRHDGGRTAALRLLAEGVESHLSSSEIKSEFERITATSLIADAESKEIVLEGLSTAVSRCLDDHVLSIAEESAILRTVEAFGLSLGAHSDLQERLVKGAILRDLGEGLRPDRLSISGSLPFRFDKSEHLVWLFQDCEYYEIRRHSHYEAGSHGVSFRIAKGVYYRVGAIRGRRITTENFQAIDSGKCAITTKHIYFAGSGKSFRVRLDKIVSCELMSNGILFYKDGANPKPQGISLDDPIFAANLIAAL